MSTWTSWLTLGYFGEDVPACGRNAPANFDRATHVVLTDGELIDLRRNLRATGRLAQLLDLGTVPIAPHCPENPYTRGYQYTPGSPLRELHRKIKPVPAH